MKSLQKHARVAKLRRQISGQVAEIRRLTAEIVSDLSQGLGELPGSEVAVALKVKTPPKPAPVKKARHRVNLSPKRKAEAMEMLKRGFAYKEIHAKYGVSLQTLYSWKRLAK